MKVQCAECSSTFATTAEDNTLMKKLSPVIGGKTYELPAPTRCPECRNQRRLSFRNDKNYYKNTCQLCRKSVISIYAPESGLPVLCQDCFWSDQSDALQYGMKMDFTQSFFEQFAELKKKVPRLCIFNTQSENSDYTVHSSRNKNCYMCSSTLASEDVYFSDYAIDSKDCSDLLMCSKMELCYRSVNSRQCFGSDYVDLCSNVTDSYLCFDCHASEGLVGCVSAKNKKFLILNEPSDKKTVAETIKKLKTDRAFRKEFRKKFEALKVSLPKREAWNLNAEDSTGDYLQNAKSVSHSYRSTNVEDCAYVYDLINGVSCMDTTRGGSCEALYECKGIIDLKLSCFCNLAYQSDSLLYCDNANNSSECFGCFGIKKAKHCILNTQYTKEEYEALVPKIIEHMKKTGEWGEFFPIQLSSFGYNESTVMEWFPMKKEEVLKRGWKWADYEQKPPKDLKAIDASRLPDTIDDVPDDILNYVIAAEDGKPFRIIPQELAFYRKRGLPLPHKHPHARIAELQKLENPRKLYARSCGKCGKGINTTYAPERPETVYCESCYLAAVY